MWLIAPTTREGNNLWARMDVKAYFKRIEYDGPIMPTQEVLTKLCWCHVSHIPFYTLDLFGSPYKKVMDLSEIYRKLILEKVGGLCYELNGLFSWLLREIGFIVDVIRTEALVNDKYGGSLVNEHLTLRVTCRDGKTRIADVSCLAVPLKLDVDEPQYQRNTKARAIRRWCDRKNAWYIHVEKLERTAVEEIRSSENYDQHRKLSWRGRFRFRPNAKSVELCSFQPNLNATVSTEGSIFKTTSYCILQTDRGIKGLFSYLYVEKDYVDDYTDVKRTTEVKDLLDFKRILRETFNVVLDYDPIIPVNKDTVP